MLYSHLALWMLQQTLHLDHLDHLDLLHLLTCLLKLKLQNQYIINGYIYINYIHACQYYNPILENQIIIKSHIFVTWVIEKSNSSLPHQYFIFLYKLVGEKKEKKTTSNT